MNRSIAKSIPMACTGLCLALTWSLSSRCITAQSPQTAITLDPPAGLEMQAHAFDSRGTRLPEAPANFRRLGEGRVGEAADVHALTFRFTATTKLTGIKSTKDFRIEPGGSCAQGTTYQAKSTCSLLVRFTPQGAGSRLGHITLSTNLSPTPFAFGLGGYGYSPIISFVPSQITTLPGSYPSNVGLLNGAQNLAIDGSDTLWVSDTGNNVVRNYDSSATFKTLASGFSAPWGITVDTFGQAYFSRPASNALHEIYDYGPVVTISGSTTGACPAATPCTLSSHLITKPGEMSMDPYNHMFFTEQSSGGAFSTVQPVPANLIFLYDPFPYQTVTQGPAAMDASDNIYSFWGTSGDCEIVQQSLYNAENNNQAFTKIAGGHTCGFAGDKGLAGNAEIGTSIGQIAFDTAGDMYFTDSANQRVRRIEYTTGVIRTIAGNGTAGYTGDGGQSTFATLNAPTGVGVDSTGSVYVISNSASSGSAQVIRKIGPNGYLNFGNQSKGTGSGSLQLAITNTGNSTLVLSGNYIMWGNNTSDFKVLSIATTCPLTTGGTLYAGQTCYVGFQFTPTATGSRSAVFRLLGNTVSGTSDAILIGNGTLPVPTLAITSPTNGASFTSGTPVTLSASVTSTSGSQPTGTVQFKVDGANFGGPVTLSGTGTASTSVTGLTQTTHSLAATYNGDANYAATGPVSVSIVVTAVKIGASVSLSPTASTSGCAPMQFAVAVTSTSSTLPTGQVSILDGTRTLATGTLSNGKITLSTPHLGPGSHSLTAHYGGDAHYLASDSGPLVEAGGAAVSCQPILPGRGFLGGIPVI
ncbi:Ig-like domain repeat protein [Occallatibacter riparius]|uniref:Ig-like domain repeat protein n=1 Tax=Occallatibacter riparius TaxID=1002689 RepID=A0A9J7BUM2_9BACT|nr:Ig-like domain repeat protein [Occallatibacter riparius]UWZ86571.1 Ig-like domain repeat protein [Occallatibacter riparius]